MAPAKRVLFFTHSEYGQAQVHLSAAYELLSQPNVEVHMASFGKLQPRVAEISELHQRLNKNSKKNLTFHLLDYPSMAEIIPANDPANIAPMHPWGWSGALASYRNMAKILLCWTPEQYVDTVKRCAELVEEIQPDAVGVDPLFFQAVDMCRNRLAPKHEAAFNGKSKYFVVTPLEFAATLADLQPSLATWWKFPV